MYLMQEGQTFNVNLPTYYCESDSELSQIPSTCPPGTVAEVNATNDFHIMMKRSDGTWNRM